MLVNCCRQCPQWENSSSNSSSLSLKISSLHVSGAATLFDIQGVGKLGEGVGMAVGAAMGVTRGGTGAVAAGGDGKTSPFLNGSGKVGLVALPTMFPLPGKM